MKIHRECNKFCSQSWANNDDDWYRYRLNSMPCPKCGYYFSSYYNLSDAEKKNHDAYVEKHAEKITELWKGLN